MTDLGAAISAAMAAASTNLSVLDKTSGEWTRHPWQEVHARAENIAERVADDGSTAVGLVGDPTVEFIAAIPGAFFAGAAVSILPGPIRRADPRQWAQTTTERFRGIGVHTVFSRGAELELRGRPGRSGAHRPAVDRAALRQIRDQRPPLRRPLGRVPVRAHPDPAAALIVTSA